MSICKAYYWQILDLGFLANPKPSQYPPKIYKKIKDMALYLHPVLNWGPFRNQIPLRDRADENNRNDDRTIEIAEDGLNRFC